MLCRRLTAPPPCVLIFDPRPQPDAEKVSGQQLFGSIDYIMPRRILLSLSLFEAGSAHTQCHATRLDRVLQVCLFRRV